jgi:hypothetical protein
MNPWNPGLTMIRKAWDPLCGHSRCGDQQCLGISSSTLALNTFRFRVSRFWAISEWAHNGTSTGSESRRTGSRRDQSFTGWEKHRQPPEGLFEAVRYANERGVIVVVAAGNDNSDARGFAPANAEGESPSAPSILSSNKASFPTP